MGIASIITGTIAVLPIILFLLPWRQMLGDDTLFPLVFMIFEGLSLLSLVVAIIGLILGIVDILLKRRKQKPKASAVIGVSVNLLVLLLFAAGILFKTH